LRARGLGSGTARGGGGGRRRVRWGCPDEGTAVLRRPSSSTLQPQSLEYLHPSAITVPSSMSKHMVAPPWINYTAIEGILRYDAPLLHKLGARSPQLYVTLTRNYFHSSCDITVTSVQCQPSPSRSRRVRFPHPGLHISIDHVVPSCSASLSHPHARGTPRAGSVARPSPMRATVPRRR
jgi:hypothetical protein